MVAFRAHPERPFTGLSSVPRHVVDTVRSGSSAGRKHGPQRLAGPVGSLYFGLSRGARPGSSSWFPEVRIPPNWHPFRAAKGSAGRHRKGVFLGGPDHVGKVSGTGFEEHLDRLFHRPFWVLRSLQNLAVDREGVGFVGWRFHPKR